MKLYCHSCSIFVAEIQHGSHIKKGSVMVCSKCIERYKIADEMARIAREGAKSIDMPDFFKNIFNK